MSSELKNKQFQKDEIEKLESFYRRNLINSITGFKSLGLVGTQSPEGKMNLALFSQVVHVGATPPLLGILFRPHTVPRNTLENILSTSYYTFNLVDKDFYKEAHHTSARWEGSEFEACNLEHWYSDHFLAPYVKRSPLKMGLKMVERLDVQSNGTILIIGSLEELWIQEQAIGIDGFVDLEKMKAVTVSGLDSYHQTIKLARLTYAKPDHFPKELELGNKNSF